MEETRYYLSKIIGTGHGAAKDPYRPVMNDLIPSVTWSACDLRVVGNEPHGFMLVKIVGTLLDHARVKDLLGCIEIGKSLTDAVETAVKTAVSTLIGRTANGVSVRDICKSIATLNPTLANVKIWGDV